MMRAKAGIFEPELVACVFCLTLASIYAPGRPVLLCCDNMGARGAVVRGSFAAVVGRVVSSVFWNVAAHFSCAVWVDFAPSCLNVADPPSRARELLPVEERATDLSCGVPAMFRRIFSSRHSSAAAQFGIDISGSPMVNGWSCATLCPHGALPGVIFTLRLRGVDVRPQMRSCSRIKAPPTHLGYGSPEPQCHRGRISLAEV